MHLQLPTVPFDQSAERRLVAKLQRVKQRIFGLWGPRGCRGVAPTATGRPGAVIPSHLITIEQPAREQLIASLLR